MRLKRNKDITRLEYCMRDFNGAMLDRVEVILSTCRTNKCEHGTLELEWDRFAYWFMANVSPEFQEGFFNVVRKEVARETARNAVKELGEITQYRETKYKKEVTGDE